MQQSLKILRRNHIELEAEIAQILDSNIMLLQNNGDDFIQDIDNPKDSLESPEEFETESLSYDIPDILDSDFEWKEIYEDSESYGYKSTESIDIDEFQESWLYDSVSFDKLLETSIYLSPLNNEGQLIASQILTYLDENYFLTKTHKELTKKLKADVDKLVRIIDVIKHLNSPGVASQSIRECLLAQLHSKDDFINGDKSLKPLLIKDISELLGLAKSTVSRAVSGKYISFNQHLIELRYFFLITYQQIPMVRKKIILLAPLNLQKPS